MRNETIIEKIRKGKLKENAEGQGRDESKTWRSLGKKRKKSIENNNER